TTPMKLPFDHAPFGPFWLLLFPAGRRPSVSLMKLPSKFRVDVHPRTVPLVDVVLAKTVLFLLPVAWVFTSVTTTRVPLGITFGVVVVRSLGSRMRASESDTTKALPTKLGMKGMFPPPREAGQSARKPLVCREHLQLMRQVRNFYAQCGKSQAEVNYRLRWWPVWLEGRERGLRGPPDTGLPVADKALPPRGCRRCFRRHGLRYRCPSNASCSPAPTRSCQAAWCAARRGRCRRPIGLAPASSPARRRSRR